MLIATKESLKVLAKHGDAIYLDGTFNLVKLPKDNTALQAVLWTVRHKSRMLFNRIQICCL